MNYYPTLGVMLWGYMTLWFLISLGRRSGRLVQHCRPPHNHVPDPEGLRIPMLEKKMAKNPDFADYKRRTSLFLPRSPKRQSTESL
jgi:hypothetical protein